MSGPERSVDTGSSDLVFSERLWAPVWMWLVPSAIAATLGFAFEIPLGIGAGIVAWAIPQALIVWMLVSAAARVTVGPDGLAAGRATLPLQAMGQITALDPTAAAALRGRDADPRAYLLLRPWLAAAVRIDLQDPRDPAPYWYISTSRPPQLAAALEGVRRQVPGHRDGGRLDEAG